MLKGLSDCVSAKLIEMHMVGCQCVSFNGTLNEAVILNLLLNRTAIVTFRNISEKHVDMLHCNIFRVGSE